MTVPTPEEILKNSFLIDQAYLDVLKVCEIIDECKTPIETMRRMEEISSLVKSSHHKLFALTQLESQQLRSLKIFENQKLGIDL